MEYYLAEKKTLSNKLTLRLYSQSTQRLVEETLRVMLVVGSMKGWGFVLLSDILLKLSSLLEEIDVRSLEISEYD